MSIKLSRHAFVRFVDLHAWAGVVASLLLYVMVLTGSVSLFYDQVSIWQEPLAQVVPSEAVSLDEVLEIGLKGDSPTGRTFVRIPQRPYGSPRVNYKAEGAEERSNVWVDTSAQERVPIREVLANFVLNIHYLWHDLTGTILYRVAGFLALTWLLLVTTGVLIHLKDIVAQFYQFRSRKTERVLWSDLHKVLGVMGLPFQLMYSYTGAFIVLTGLLLSGLSDPVFNGDKAQAQRIRRGPAIVEPAVGNVSGPGVSSLPLEQLVVRAQRAEPLLRHPTRLTLTGMGTEERRVSISGVLAGTVPEVQGKVVLAAASGRVLQVKNSANRTPQETLRAWVFGLHYGLFGGITLKVLYFLMGLATCGTILTGNWVWLTKREAKRAAAGKSAVPVLSRLTAGVGGGALVAIAAVFLTSRCLPLDWAARKGMEELSFFVALMGCLIWGVLAKNTRAVWRQQLALAGVLLSAVAPLASRWSTAGLWGAGSSLPPVLGVDVGLTLGGVSLCGVAWVMARSQRSTSVSSASKVRVRVAHA